MPIGYSRRLVDEVSQADSKKLGVRLGLRCLLSDVPVARVAKALGVSRVTVYSWFRGKTDVPDRLSSKVERLIDELD
jgi:AcrR family transcriptional regulator